jgi:hypothetical protein
MIRPQIGLIERICADFLYNTILVYPRITQIDTDYFTLILTNFTN